MSTNDERILQYKKLIEEKKKKLTAKFAPVTHCSITIGEKRHNLHAMNSKNDLQFLLIKVNMLHASATELGIDEEYTQDGHLLSDWKKDILSKLAVVGQKGEAKAIKDMEAKLGTLLSKDKKTELELDAIAQFLQ